jgi:Ca2+-binding RTX toxin-like protein
MATAAILTYDQVGSEFLVNTTIPGDQSQSSISGLEDGSFVIVWTSDGQDGSGTGIYAQRYAADGTASGEMLVNETTGDAQLQPVVAGLPDGGYVVVWTSSGQDGSDYGVYSQRFDAAGTPQGETAVNQFTGESQYQPSVAALSDGGYVVTWASETQDGSGLGIYARRYDATGAAEGEMQVNSSTTNAQQQPSVTGLSDGSFVIAWTSDLQDGSGTGIYSKRYDASGTAAGEVQVNTWTALDQSDPSVTALLDGGFVISWASDGQDGSGGGIYAQRYDASGAPQGEGLVNTTMANTQSAPSITGLADGGYLVTWTSQSQDGDGRGVYSQRFDALGAPMGDETLVNTFTSYDQYQPAVTTLADGGYVVTWSSYAQDGGSHGVYAQRYSGPIAATEQTPADLKGKMSVADPDASSGDIFSLIVGVTHGILVVTEGSSGATVDDSGTASVTITGTLAQINALLSSDGTSTVEYSSDADAPPSTATLELALHQGGPGGPIAAGDMETIYISGVNDLPTVTVPGAQQGTEDIALVLSGANAISVADVDGGELTVTLEVEKGTLGLSGAAGLNFEGGDGTGDALMTFTGSVAEINAALDGLSYLGEANYAGSDTLTITTSDGTDEDVDTVAITLADDDLYTGTGDPDVFSAPTDLNWTINGLGGDDVLTGAGGDDMIDGGSGADDMTGGAGNDTFIVDDAGDVVIELVNGGGDTVESSVSYRLVNYVEKLVLTGSANIDATGSSLANVLVGNDGNNVLDGRYGDDEMSGGDGDDTYVVNQSGDVVIEEEDEGTDIVQSSVSWTLGGHVEHLVLTGSGNTGGTGNALANSLTGNQGANRLDGGAGADVMAGKSGNDIYVVDDLGDQVVELDRANGGTDTVEASIGYKLAANVENLVLTGTGDIDGFGNSGANMLTGNDGDNILDGGYGADQMSGGVGDDTYIVNEDGDVVIEEEDEGTDSVQSSASFVLGDHVESLKLTGTGNADGTGNALANAISGNTGANRIAGGLGNDVLKGGGGTDTFVFDALGEADADQILDFSRIDDTIELDGGTFEALGPDTLGADAFHKGSAAADAEDRIVYDSATGNIFYDADGSGTDADAILVATLNPGTNINNLDFFVTSTIV